MRSSKRVILIDADVVSHFVTANEAGALHQVFPENTICMLDKVHAELQRWPSARMRTVVSELLGSKKIRLMDFPEENEDIKKEYTRIKSVLFKGDGESACLAVAKYQDNILASSNLRDITHYCKMHRIDYLTTMDFLCESLRTGLFDLSRCNRFITIVLAARGTLPVVNMNEYLCREIDFL